jgi:hypothetical protein
VVTAAWEAARCGRGTTTGADQRLRGRGCSWCAAKGERRREKRGTAASGCTRFKRCSREQRKGGLGTAAAWAWAACNGPRPLGAGGAIAARTGEPGSDQWASAIVPSDGTG